MQKAPEQFGAFLMGKKMKITAQNPSGLIVEFDSEEHRYKIRQTGCYLNSATTFIGEFFPHFDADAMAPRCVGKPKYKGMSADEIKAAWDAESLRGRTEGTNVHYYAECLMNGDFANIPVAQSDREQKLFDQVVLAVLRLEERFQFIASEYIVFSPYLGIAGTIDLLMADMLNMDLIILDWKQNKVISTSNPYGSGSGPIAHLDASDFNKYALQLNLYEMIIRREGYFKEFKGVRKALIHLKEEGVPQVIKIPTGSFQNDLVAMVDDIIPF